MTAWADPKPSRLEATDKILDDLRAQAWARRLELDQLAGVTTEPPTEPYDD